MPNAFTITTSAVSTGLPAGREGAATFTVSNVSGATLRGEARVWAAQPGTAGWIKVAEPVIRGFAADATEQFTVRFAPGPQVPGGSYRYRLDVVGADDPDEVTDEGPEAVVEVPPLPSLARPRVPRWALLAAGAVVLVAIVLLLVLR